MSLNWKEINLILSELSLEGVFIEEWLQSDFRNLYLRCFRPGQRFWLRLCFENGRCSIFATSTKPTKPAQMLRFCSFLRSRCRNGKIIEVSQPGNDRIIRLCINSHGSELRLYIRFWGGAASNIIATDSNDVILDLLYRKKYVSIGEQLILETGIPSDTEIREYQGSFNDAIESFYTEQGDTALLEKLQASFVQYKKKKQVFFQRRKQSLEKQQKDADLIQQYQHYGDAIMCNLHRCKQGDKVLHIPEEELSIELDSDKKPHENAAEFYSHARKLREKIRYIEQKLEQHHLDTEKFKRTLLHVQIDNTESLQNFLQTQQESPQKTEKKARPGRQFHSGGFDISVGRDAKESDALLRNYTRGNDIWLHVRDYPGGYVFIHTKKNCEPSQDVLLDAATLALFFSKARKHGSGDLYYTAVKHLKRAKHGVFGTVLPQHEKNIHIRLDSARLSRLGIKIGISP